MTEERLNEIIYLHTNAGLSGESFDALQAMKQAVNEVLDEAAEKAEAWVSSNGEWTSSKVSARVDKKSILNLKVK